MRSVTGLVLMAVGLGGVVLFCSGVAGARRARLAARLRPYLGRPEPRPAPQRASGGDRPAAGERFRRYPAAVASAAAVLVLLSLGLSVRSGAAALVVATGPWVWPRYRQAQRRRQAQAEALAELPTVVDLASLALAAGEGIRGALELVSRVDGGPVVDEIRRAVRRTRLGEPLGPVLREGEQSLDLAEFARFVDLVTTSAELGAPVGESLRALAFDVREGHKRRLIERAARQEMAMIGPVVTLILPVAVVFALFPGVVALRQLAP